MVLVFLMTLSYPNAQPTDPEGCKTHLGTLQKDAANIYAIFFIFISDSVGSRKHVVEPLLMLQIYVGQSSSRTSLTFVFC
uniref:Uncharacterized protein n=1 Tax=Brassica oleracea TaxID=3712 RepID=A0A3P6CWW3_BRAOL|nr:unnamed protein product [Brassica oleracea]